MNTDSARHRGQGTDSSITWVIAHHVRPDRERDFEEWLKGITEELAHFRGYQGVTILRPGESPHPDYVLVVRFATYDDNLSPPR